MGLCKGSFTLSYHKNECENYAVICCPEIGSNPNLYHANVVLLVSWW